jgi:hypothetical protein
LLNTIARYIMPYKFRREICNKKIKLEQAGGH